MVRWAAALLALVFLPATTSAQQAQADPQAEARTHTVEAGNTLWSLARAYYGDPYEWTRIFEANRDRVPDPDRLEPGLVLRLPAAAGAAAARDRPTALADDSAALPDPAGGGAVLGLAVRPAGSGSGRLASPEAGPPEGAPAASGDVRSGDPTERTGFYREPVEPRAPAGATSPDGYEPLRPPSEDDFLRARWLAGADGPEHSGRIRRVGSGLRPHRTAFPFDQARLDLEGGTPEVGTRLQTFRVGRSIPGLGRVVVPTGTVRVTGRDSAGAVAVVDDIFGRVIAGDLVRPLPEFPLTPAMALEPAVEQTRTTVIGVAEQRPLRARGDQVFLDVGGSEGVRVGDVFVGAAPGDIASAADAPGRGGTAGQGEVAVPGDRAPGRVRVQVVSVHDGYATARILALENPEFRTGVVLRLSRRMR